MEDHFCIAGGLKDNTFLFQLFFQFRHVIDLTIVDNGVCPGGVFLYHGLMACDKVDDLQSYVGQAAAAVQVSSLVIRPPAFLRLVHFVQNVIPFPFLLRKISFQITKSCNSTHDNSPFCYWPGRTFTPRPVTIHSRAEKAPPDK